MAFEGDATHRIELERVLQPRLVDDCLGADLPLPSHTVAQARILVLEAGELRAQLVVPLALVVALLPDGTAKHTGGHAGEDAGVRRSDAAWGRGRGGGTARTARRRRRHAAPA